ncbi:MAG: hypothetical protein ACPGWR_01750 [Ardenticatenaceae bacterium]
MIKIRITILILFGYTILLVILNESCPPSNDALCIKPSTYITTLLIVISILAIPALSRYTVSVSLILAVVAYLSSILFFSNGALIGGTYTYLRIVEVVMLSLAVVLAHGMAYHLYEVEQAMFKIASKELEYNAMSFEQAADSIRLEFIRSRQYEHPLSVVVVEVDKEQSNQVLLGQALEEVQQAIANRLRMVSLARLIGQQVQRTDVILNDDTRNRLLILCPETDETKSSLLAQHIRSAAVNRLGVPVSCGSATFPVDALTFDELVRHAESYLSHNEIVKTEVEYS